MSAASKGRARKGSPRTMRLRLLECPDCGCKVRLPRIWLVRCAELGRRPQCVVCGAEASCPDLEDAALYDSRAAEQLAETVWDVDRDQPFVKRGRTWTLASLQESDKRRVPQHRCEFVYPSGKTCSRFPSKGAKFCKVHADQETPF